MRQIFLDQQGTGQAISLSGFPTLPTVALEVIGLVQRENVGITAIADVISHDPALTSRILKTVNSGYYGPCREVGTISSAVAILGLDTVKSLALGFSLAEHLPGLTHESLDLLAFWKRSIYSAMSARSLARRLQLAHSEEAFLSALLLDLGMVAMAQSFGAVYPSLVEEAGHDHAKLIELERAHCHYDHVQLGVSLADQWNLPPVLVEPIRYHTQPDDGSDKWLPQVRCVALGSDAATVFLDQFSKRSLGAYRARLKQWFGLSEPQADALLAETYKETMQAAWLFNMPSGGIESPEEMLARARDAMLKISLDQQQKASQLKQQNLRLAKQLFTDPVTGAGNRRLFDEYFQEQLERAGRGMGYPSLLFMDLDNFKGLNDGHGHQAGDRVLAAVSDAIKSVLPASALVARYGGDEFAVVLLNHDLPDAMRVAQRVRQRVGSTPIECGLGLVVHTSVSVGVASWVTHRFASKGDFIHAADQALYASKAMGRNRVCGFTRQDTVTQEQDPVV